MRGAQQSCWPPDGTRKLLLRPLPRTAVEDFSAAADSQAKWMMALTIMIGFLTVVLVWLTAKLVWPS